MSVNLVPKKARHSWINLLRPPYNKKLPDSYEQRDALDEFQKKVDFLFDTFLENYNRYKAGEMPVGLEKAYRDANLPGPLQYKAFGELVNFFKDEEFWFLKNKNFYYHDLNLLHKQPEIGMVEFVRNLIGYDFAGQEKKVVFCCGSFWKIYPDIREEMLRLFEELYKDKGIAIHIYTNCNKEEIKGHDEFLTRIEGGSFFGLKERIPIHFIQAGNDFYYIEFPHGEQIKVRLNMFMDLEKIDKIEYKDSFGKADVEQFFNKLIQQAVS